MIKNTEKSAELMRHQLGSIDMSDILELQKEKMTDEFDQERSSAIEIFYKSYFDKPLKLIIQKQLEFIGKEATDLEKLTFARGTFNGLTLIQEWMEVEINKSLSRFDENDNDES